MARAGRVKSLEGADARKYFYEQFRLKKGRAYNASFIKDQQLLTTLCCRYSLAWVKGLIDFYLQWDDDFTRLGGYTVGILYLKVNAILELGIGKSEWVRKHERKNMLSTGQILMDIMRGGGNIFGGKK